MSDYFKKRLTELGLDREPDYFETRQKEYANAQKRKREKEMADSLRLNLLNREEEEEDLKWYEKGLFEDGYDFGDVTKTILGISDKKKLKTFTAPDTTDTLEELKQKADYLNNRKWNSAEQTADALKYTQQYNQMALSQYADTLSKTKIEGQNHTVLEEIEILANMKNGKEKDKRKQAVLDKMEELGMDKEFYAHFAGDGEFNWDTFSKWLYNSSMAGLNTFNKGILDTADVILGAPLKAMGVENNPFSKGAEYYDDLYSSYRYNANLYAEKLGGNAWNFGSDAVEGTMGALPNALLMFMTGGASATATTNSLMNQAAMQTGNVLTKAGLTTSKMMKDPQYWMSFARTLGSDYKEAKELGASDMAAAVGSVLKSTINSGIEIGLDGGSGIQGLDDALKKGGKPFWEWVESSLEEGGEEVLQKFVGEMVNKFGYGSDEEILNPIEYAKEGTLGVISGAALGGGQTAVQRGVNAFNEHQANKLTDMEQSVKDKIVEKRIAQKEKDGKTLSAKEKADIEKEVERNLRKGYLSADEIEEAIGGEVYESYKAEQDKFFASDAFQKYDKTKRDSQKRIAKMEKQLQEIGEQPNTVANSKKYDAIQNRIELLNKRTQQMHDSLLPEAQRIMGIKDQMRSQMMGTVKDSRLAESYRELGRSKQKFQADVNKYQNENAKKTVQSILDSGLGDNSNQFHETVEWLAKLSEERNVTFDLTKTERLKGTKHYREGYVTNGFKTKDGDLTKITVNLDGNVLNTTVGHEITHVLEEAGIYKDLSKAVHQFAISKEGQEAYNARLAAVKEIYGEDQTTIDSEITADIIGEYLFTDYDFVHSLSTQNRNVFQKVYDEIKYMVKIATAGSKEARELERVKKMFDKAWRENVKGKPEQKTETNESKATIDPENDADLDYESPTKYSVSVKDPETIDFLENQEHITTYKAMVLVDGKLYPPMASKVKGEDGKYHMTNPRELGEWMQAEEDTTNIKFNDKGIGYYDLKKDDGGTVRAAYNPYEHSSNLVLNDQFEAAYKRGNLVTVECVIPKSEMDNPYKAEYAKDSTGVMDWHSGVVAGKLTDNKRSVYLSRYLKVNRIVPDSEVAQKYKEIVGDLAVPFNVVSPSLLTELENVGVNIDYDGSPQYQYLQRKAAEREAKKNTKYSMTKAIDKDYLDAVNRGDMKTAQKMVDDVAKESGYDIKAYHGTGYDFTVFDKSRQGNNYQDWGRLGKGFYFAPTEREARTWAELSRGGKNKVMPVYLRIENMLDSFEALPDNLKDTIPEDWDSLTKRLAEKYAYHYIDYMQEFGYNVQEILVSKGYDGINGHVEFVVFDPEQVKSADPITYDEYGDVIMPYERFSQDNMDIRYSMTKDTNGRDLTDFQKDFFKDSKVVDENGNLKVMYHGTPNGDFTVFKDGTYFTDNKEYADRYQNPSASSISSGKAASAPKTFEVYLDIKKPFDLNDAEARDIYINEYIKGGNAMGINPYLSDAEYAKIKTIDWTEGEDLRDFLIENEYDYDGLVLDEGATGGYGDDVNSRGTSWVVFSPEQVKNVDNAKPTSNPDIRFSMTKVVEETKDLMALHNLHSSELMKQLQMGGMPYPSVAITKPEMISHDNYGEISLILHKNAIDPKTNKYNKIYSADAYTPTFPNVDYEASEEAVNRITSVVNAHYYELPDYYQRSLRSLRDYSNIDDELNRWGGEQRYLEKYADDYGLKQLYLAQKGEAVSVETKRTESRLTDHQMNLYATVVDKVGEDTLRSFNERGEHKTLGQARLAWLDEHGEILKDIYADSWMIDGIVSKEEALEIANEQTKHFWKDEIISALKYIENGGITVTETEDIGSTNAKIDEKIANSDYKEWVANLFSGIEGQSGIRNGKDIFTPSGNRRSFKQTHDPLTIDNIVKAMRKENQTGQGAFGGGSILGASAQEYGSIAEVKRNSDKLGVMDTKGHDTIKDQINDTFWDIARRYANGKDIIDAQETIAEAVSKNESKAGIARYLKQYDYVYKYTDEIGDEIIELRDYIRSLPTPYFEAKPRRGVGFDEVAAFVIPRNADIKLKQELLSRGYNIAEYDPDVKGDRQKVVNQFEEYKFSLSPEGKKPTTSGDWHIDGREFGYHDEFEDFAPIREDADAYKQKATVDKTETVGDNNAPTEKEDEETPRPTTRKAYHASIIDRIKATFAERGFDFDEVLNKARNLSTFGTVDNTPQRVMEKSLGYKEGGVLADLTVNQVAQNESEGIKWLNSFTDRKTGLLAQISKQYHIKPGSNESAAAQMYAEGFYVNENNEIIRYGDPELIQDFSDPKVRANIKGLAQDPRIRQIYDETLKAINESRTRNLYPEIPRLDNYFLHFRAMEDTFSRLGLPFNPNDIRAKDLPTDLNGVTADLKPGQPYFASAMHRTGKRTSFDLLGGLEKYLTSAKNQIYHIDDIQTLRALRNYIADTYGQANGLEDLDSLNEDEVQFRIEQVFNSHLSTFAKFLNEEANIIAGKTPLIDRGIEGMIGRRAITFLNTLNGQVGSNMVGYNISSALTNFLSVAQGFAKTNKADFVKAFAQTVSNKVNSISGNGDGFAEASPVMIRRKGAERFYRTPWQKMADPGYALMSAVDDISTELIARTKYNEFIRKGMDAQQAHFETDKWVSKLMGDRSLGQMPQLFNSKTLGLITKFQLEVRNQLDSQFYDTIQEAKVSSEDIENAQRRNMVTAAKIGSSMFQMAVVQHLFGKAFESVAGYNPAFDIIEVLMTALGWDDEEEEPVLDNIEQAFMELMDDMPYSSILTGGRIPISSALPIEQFIKGEDQYGNEKSRWETLGEVAPYYLMPGGYGQLKKTVAGLEMFPYENPVMDFLFDRDHPVAGSYTDSGNLRFPVDDTLGNRAKAAVFGQYASANARDYFDNERSALKPSQIEEFAKFDAPIQDYWEYRDGLKGLDTIGEKTDYIDSLDLPISTKNMLINNLYPDRKTPIDLNGYGEYDSYEEFDWATKNPEKYEFFSELGISYSDYKNADDEKKKDYNWAYDYPQYVTLSKAVTDDIWEYREYYKDMVAFKADKDANGKSISGSKKAKVIDYIDSLDIDYGAKLVLLKSQYESVDDYNAEIFEYIKDKNDLTFEEKLSILKTLGFGVSDDGTVTWD